MPYTFEQLRELTVVELREIAAGIQHEAVQGYTQLNKEHLLVALCKALNVDAHIHRRAAKAVAVDKTEIKSKLKELKERREIAIKGHDHVQLKSVRHEMHELRRTLRKAAGTPV